MKRPCFHCGAEPEVLVRSTWNLTGLAPQEIGFAVCDACGAVLQSPCADPETLRGWYAETAVYANPGRGGKPDARKVAMVEAQIALVKRAAHGLPRTAFQVGCSDGYTLACFREAGAVHVAGVDPSQSAVALARDFHGVDAQLGTVEEFELGVGWSLFILTHVLEHLRDPRAVLARVAAVQAPGAWLLVEVPLFEHPERFPPTTLTFEHLNYWSEELLLQEVAAAGYRPEVVASDLSGEIYPVVTVLARRAAPDEDPSLAMPPLSKVSLARARLEQHLEREEARWDLLEERVLAVVDEGSPVWLWGAGVHTTQLLACTRLAELFDVRGLFDSSPSVWGKSLGAWSCTPPERAELGAGDTLLISSYAAQEEIHAALQPWRERGVRTLRLYPELGPDGGPESSP